MRLAGVILIGCSFFLQGIRYLSAALIAGSKFTGHNMSFYDVLSFTNELAYLSYGGILIGLTYLYAADVRKAKSV